MLCFHNILYHYTCSTSAHRLEHTPHHSPHTSHSTLLIAHFSPHTFLPHTSHLTPLTAHFSPQTPHRANPSPQTPPTTNPSHHKPLTTNPSPHTPHCACLIQSLVILTSIHDIRQFDGYPASHKSISLM